MPKAEKGTPKAIANAMKSKGLQRLRWYCQVCEKQCRDENGFKCHTMSEGHVRQMLVVGENAGKYINDYSDNFKKDFLALLSRRWGTKRVLANMVYQEYIADKNHLHMNATQWVTLTEFVKQMGREGVLHVDETEKGLHMAWIDNSPQALSRQAAHQAKERSQLDDEQRMRKLIAEQIQKANQEQAERMGASAETDESKPSTIPDQERVLKREEADGPLKLSFGISTPAASSLTSSTTPTSTTNLPASTSKLPTNPLKGPSTNPLKKPNPLKRPSTNPLKSQPSKATEKPSNSSATSKPNPSKMSALESIIAEDEARKRRKDERTWSGANGHGASGLQIKRSS
ncbi:hypothetical protein PTTG_04801 [Puccinia triticina 1-1 BBBD Race 1]|uniref:Kin17_mid domain-containing protein n=1 Tax=Puccinia triticina (isolate 1-1 / race 1 (BBBD)) TaxID=630390 RepID=A0A180GE98_PUCT1|nr:hypothetical protein PTTG_04801 [Puccinia triticina 1-1 BBBD Race 1]